MTLPLVERDGTVSLADFRGKSGVLLALFRGLHCPFCRRQLFQLAGLRDTLAGKGVETVTVVNTTLGRARLYFGAHPVRSVLLADPEAAAHRAFGVPEIDVTTAEFAATRINPTGELAEALSPLESNVVINRQQGFTLAPDDEKILAAHGAQLAAHFLLDRDGVVRWARLEAERGAADIGRFPSNQEILAAAATLG